MKKLLTPFLLLSSIAYADDIEVYTKQNSHVQPNVLLIMDTSRSMSIYEEFDLKHFSPTGKSGYDSEATYPNSLHGYRNDVGYFASVYSGEGSNNTEINAIRDQSFPLVNMKCKGAINALGKMPNQSGYYDDRFAVYKSGWERLSIFDETLSSNNLLECHDDQGVHGISDSSDKVYIDPDTGGGNSNPYQKDAHRQDHWTDWGLADDKIGRAFIFGISEALASDRVFAGNYLNYKMYEINNNERTGSGLGIPNFKHNEGRLSRYVIVREALRELLNDPDPSNQITNINLGLMKFDGRGFHTSGTGSQGGRVDVHVEDINTTRTDIVNKLDSYFTWGSTPFEETYKEASDYFSGRSIHYGNGTQDRIPNSNMHRYYDPSTNFLSAVISGIGSIFSESAANIQEGLFVAQTGSYTSKGTATKAKTGSKYKSPITNNCQTRNHIIYFSDGLPEKDTSSRSAIESLIGKSCSQSGNGGCAVDLAEYLANEDQRPDLDGDQIINTHTIGGFFGANSGDTQFLKDVAEAGGGRFYNANSFEEIKSAFREALTMTSLSPQTFVAPSLAVNTYSNLEYLDQLYYGVFHPSLSPVWYGNLKRYRLDRDSNDLLVIKDANNNPAVDPDTGFFKETAQSFWTLGSEPDGFNVKKGGAASRFGADRKIYTYLANSEGNLNVYPLLNNDNANSIPNNINNKSLFNVTNYSDSKFHNMLIWAKGINVDADGSKSTRLLMEDPLHSTPLVVSYFAEKNENTNEYSFDNTIFIGTNSGFLHAFDSNENNPKEYFSFVPKELLSNFKHYYDGETTFGKVYGMDGPLSIWHNDLNRNGILLQSAGGLPEKGINSKGDEVSEHIFLYAGMRRGGRNYYSLDITNRNAPKYKWQITGGSTGFEELGQTWSTMTPAKVRFNDKDRLVVFFGGGYHESEDDFETRNSSPVPYGNAIFMVDATTGELLWKATHSSKQGDFQHDNMTNSIVADIKIIDSTGDGLIDSFFTADTGGRLWRFDINNGNVGRTNFSKGTLIADINGETKSTNRRFYSAPDVAYFKYSTPNGTKEFFTYNIGSGFRAHPLSTDVNNFFYVIRDKNVYSAPSTYTTLNHDDLTTLNFTENVFVDSDYDDTGFVIPLETSSDPKDDGRKVLARSMTINNVLYFTTYTPIDETDPTTCTEDMGDAHLYSVTFDTITHKPKINTTKLKQSTIPAPPQIVALPPKKDEDKDGDGQVDIADCTKEGANRGVLVGAELVQQIKRACSAVEKTYWSEIPNEYTEQPDSGTVE